MPQPLGFVISVIVLLGLAGTGCSSNSDPRIELQLGDEADTATATFESEDPRTHSQTIHIEIEPADANLTLEFETTNGGTLTVLRGSEESRDCQTDEEGGTSICTIRFPILEAQVGGAWEATASKQEGPPATLTFDITWGAAN